MGRVSDKVLTERECTILGCIVESYVKTALPVGSRALARTFNLGVSPATIRNTMNDLEEFGYLCQPHVSAGRIPTDKGYRFYVDGLVSFKKPSKREREIILERLQRSHADVNEVLDAASGVLGKISSQLGVVLEPRFYQGVFQRLELVSVSENRILAVISIKSGLVKTIMMEIESGVSHGQLHETSRIINERLFGLSLRDVKATIDKRLKDVTVHDNRLIRLVLESSDRLFNFESQEGMHFGGTSNIVANPEFSDQTDVMRILAMMESRESILGKFDAASSQKISIRIGRENEGELFRNCSIITSRYHVGDVTGTLGVVGPTRMQYGKIVPLVAFMGDVLSDRFNYLWS